MFGLRILIRPSIRSFYFNWTATWPIEIKTCSKSQAQNYTKTQNKKFKVTQL